MESGQDWRLYLRSRLRSPSPLPSLNVRVMQLLHAIDLTVVFEREAVIKLIEARSFTQGDLQFNREDDQYKSTGAHTHTRTHNTRARTKHLEMALRGVKQKLKD